MNLEEFCVRLHALQQEEKDPARFIPAGRFLLGELLGDSAWFRRYLERLILEPEFLTSQEPSVYPNEVTLFRSPDRAFSVQAYFWEPRTTSAVHDHGSWGIVGAMIYPMRERKYRRLDDGKTEGRAELAETSRTRIRPGETTCVLPLNEGIHLMEAPEEHGAVSLSVYGRSVRYGYIQFFDLNRKTVRRIYPPRLLKKVLAIRALGYLAEPWGEEILRASAAGPRPECLEREIQRSLERIRSKEREGKGEDKEQSA
jgi:predicted metal-dependent enzyme (double-stranded beta helix superfamily)